MYTIKILGCVLLAVYLILVGLSGFTPIPPVLLSVVAIVSGVLLLVSIAKSACCDTWHKDECCHKEDK